MAASANCTMFFSPGRNVEPSGWKQASGAWLPQQCTICAALLFSLKTGTFQGPHSVIYQISKQTKAIKLFSYPSVYPSIDLSIYPSISCRLLRAGSRGQQLKQGRPHFHLPSCFFQLFQGIPRHFQASWETLALQRVLGLPGASYWPPHQGGFREGS